jgi:hypothetical protein
MKITAPVSNRASVTRPKLSGVAATPRIQFNLSGAHGVSVNAVGTPAFDKKFGSTNACYPSPKNWRMSSSPHAVFAPVPRRPVTRVIGDPDQREREIVNIKERTRPGPKPPRKACEHALRAGNNARAAERSPASGTC